VKGNPANTTPPNTTDPPFITSGLWSELRARKQTLEWRGSRWTENQNTADFITVLQ